MFSKEFPDFAVSVSQNFDRGAVLPPISSEYLKIRQSSGYVGKRIKDLNARYQMNQLEMSQVFGDYTSKIDQLYTTFGDLFTDYDRQIILPNTCALSYKKPSHTDLEASGSLSSDGANFTYSKEVYDAVLNWYLEYLDTDVSSKLSLPRGKNLGAPTPVGGRTRELADVLLALHVALALGGKRNGYSLQDIASFLETYHGPLRLIYGERQQHSAKIRPMLTSFGEFASQNFEPRVRGIWMSPKFMVAYNRPVTKRMLRTILRHPLHSQDRKVIHERISSGITKYETIAIDVSGFDKSHGGIRGLQMADLFCDIVGASDIEREAIKYETQQVSLGFAKGAAYEIPGNTILGSGLGHTTVIGCLGNACAMIASVSDILGVTPSEAVRLYGSRWHACAWGDDGVIMLPKGTDMDDVKRAYLNKAKLSVDEEDTIKFLGQNYAKGRFQGSMTMAYSLGRAAQQQFFPERKKLYPFSTIGYIARLSIMDEAVQKVFHDRMLTIWDQSLLGAPFIFEKRFDVLKSLIPLMQKKSNQLSQVDDVLMVLLHGITDEDLMDLADPDENFLDFIGMTSYDFSDPHKALEELQDRDSYKLSDGVMKMIGLIQDRKSVV